MFVCGHAVIQVDTAFSHVCGWIMHFFPPFSDLGLPKFDNHSGEPLMNVFNLNIWKLSHL